MTGSQVRSPVCGTSFSKNSSNSRRSRSRMRLRDLSHIRNRLPRIVSASTSRGDTNMRKFILIAGFVLASAAAQAGDRSLSLGGGETTTAPAPAKATEHRKARKSRRLRKPRNMSSGPRSSSPRPRRASPRRAGPRRATPRGPGPGRPGCSGTPLAPRAPDPEDPSARRAAMMSRSAGAHRMRYGIRARIISALHRHGIYW